MKVTNVVIAVAFGAATLAAWAYANRPTAEPAWPSRVQGFAFSPYRGDQDPSRGDFPSVAQIDSDLALLEGKTHAVRSYSTAGTLAEIPALAAGRNINVALGAWINDNSDNNEAEIERVISLASSSRNVVRVIVGNEAVLRGDTTIETLTTYLDRVRDSVGQPVSTAEPWHVWLHHPELAEHVDYLAVHAWTAFGFDSIVGGDGRQVRGITHPEHQKRGWMRITGAVGARYKGGGIQPGCEAGGEASSPADRRIRELPIRGVDRGLRSVPEAGDLRVHSDQLLRVLSFAAVLDCLGARIASQLLGVGGLLACRWARSRTKKAVAVPGTICSRS